MAGDPMMDVISREPVHLRHAYLQVSDRTVADVGERERLRAIGTLVADGADQARPTGAREREDGQEIRFVQVDVQFAVDRGTGGGDAGDVEELPIRPARLPRADRLAHLRAHAITPRDISRAARRLRPVQPAQAGGDLSRLVYDTHDPEF